MKISIITSIHKIASQCCFHAGPASWTLHKNRPTSYTSGIGSSADDAVLARMFVRENPRQYLSHIRIQVYPCGLPDDPVVKLTSGQLSECSKFDPGPRGNKKTVKHKHAACKSTSY